MSQFNSNTEPARPEQEPQKPMPTPGNPEKQQTGGAGVEINPGELNNQNEVDLDSSEIKPQKPQEH